MSEALELQTPKQKTMAAYYNDNTIIYFNGEFVKAKQAKTDLYSQSLHYGYTFEVSAPTPVGTGTKNVQRQRTLWPFAPFGRTDEDALSLHHKN